MEERLNERAARQIVARALGVSVHRHDDGSAAAQVDALIHLRGERMGALEIVADHESEFNAQWAALEKLGHRLDAPGVVGVWNAWLARRARVGDVAKQLPKLTVAWQEWMLARDSESWRRRGEVLPEEITRLGVRSMSCVQGAAGDGVIHLYAEGWSGWTGDDDEVASFVERVLREQSDVPRKLAAHGADQRHAFIWTTIGSDYGVQRALEDRGQEPPGLAPVLPQGVTHVWIAGSFNSQGALAWFPDRGWWRVPLAWPLSLDDDTPLRLGVTSRHACDPRGGALDVALLGLAEDVEIRHVNSQPRPRPVGRTAGT